MSKFKATFTRTFEVDIEATDIAAASMICEKILAGFPERTAKLMSILAEGRTVDDGVEPPKHTPPRGKPTGGGSPGTPVLSAPSIVDQVAKVA